MVITHKGSERAAIRQTDTGVELEHQPAPQQRELIGYVLPLDKDNISHLTVFIDGTMLRTEPQRTDDQGLVTAYKNGSSPNASPDDFETRGISTVDQAITYLRNSDIYRKVTDINNTEAAEAKFTTHFDQSITVATELKAERDRARRGTMRGFVNKFDTFFKRGEQPSQEPPPVPPSQPPTPPQA